LCKLPEIIGTRRKKFFHGTVNINFKSSGVEQFLKGWIKAVSPGNCNKKAAISFYTYMLYSVTDNRLCKGWIGYLRLMK